MNRILLSIAILLLATGVIANGQQTEDVISGADKAEIIESVLDFELRIQALFPDFANAKNVSSENLEFIESTSLSKRGLRLVPAAQLRGWGQVEYLLFREISYRNGVALVVLSRVKRREPCWAPVSYTERTYKYEVRQTSGEWVAELIRSPVQSIPFRR